MVTKSLKTLEVPGREQWRQWLRDHHGSEPEIWLVYHKRRGPEPSITYSDSLEEALCFGWIDSLIRRLDDDRYARKFTPRKPGSKWSSTNRRLYAGLKARGLLAAPGLERAPTAKSGDAPRPSLTVLPAYIEKALAANPRARSHFEHLAPSCRRAYLGWIDSAKRDETRQRRLREAITLLAAGRKLGMK